MRAVTVPSDDSLAGDDSVDVEGEPHAPSTRAVPTPRERIRPGCVGFLMVTVTPSTQRPATLQHDKPVTPRHMGDGFVAVPRRAWERVAATTFMDGTSASSARTVRG